MKDVVVEGVVVGGVLPQDGEVIVQAIVDVVRDVQHLIDECRCCHIRGRPQIPISEELLQALLELHFSNHDIANLLQVSPRTIRRRIIQLGLQEERCFTDINDADLDAITRQFFDTHPKSGTRLLAGFLRGMDLRIQRSRVRESLIRVDPRGVQT